MAYRVISLEASEELSRLGISHRALSEIFLGPDNVDTRIDLSRQCTIIREGLCRARVRAGDFSFRALRGGKIRVPDLWTEEMILCPCGFTTPTRDGLPYDLLPIYYPAGDLRHRVLARVLWNIWPHYTRSYTAAKSGYF